jgi:hypothetical protein
MNYLSCFVVDDKSAKSSKQTKLPFSGNSIWPIPLSESSDIYVGSLREPRHKCRRSQKKQGGSIANKPTFNLVTLLCNT